MVGVVRVHEFMHSATHRELRLVRAEREIVVEIVVIRQRT